MSPRNVPIRHLTSLIFCLVLLTAMPIFAKFSENPDSNTLWVEDGANISTGKTPSSESWTSGTDSINVAAAPNGGGVILDAAGKPHTTGRYVKFDPAYSYITWQVTHVEPGDGYRKFTVRTLDSNAFAGMVTHIQTGIYTCKTQYAFPKAKTAFLRLILHNAKVTFKYLKVVKEPENYAEINIQQFKSKSYLELGDEVQFKVKLAEPAEDVTLRFYHNYIMKPLELNGSQTLGLKPEDDQKKIWSARVKITDCTPGNLKHDQQFNPGTFLAKATVLGGAIHTPIWTANPVEFRFNATHQPSPAR